MSVSIDTSTETVTINQVQQTINLTLPNGSQEPVPLSVIDATNAYIVCGSIAYGVEVGASIVMLGVILSMTPRKKFWRFINFVNIAALCNNIIRVALLATYYQSSWVTTYTLYSGDLTYVTRADVANTITATVLAIPQNIMIMTALITQAWAMVKLWPKMFKCIIILLSLVLVVLQLGFMAATQAYQITYELPWKSAEIMLSHMWVRYGFLALNVISICWFCFLFNFKLAVHLWRHRGLLAQKKGLSAMDALVVTNGTLMLIPVIFACLQYTSRVKFEAGSMLYTSVIIVLPLGALVAQRIADPAAFSNSELSNSTTRVENHVNHQFGRLAANNKGDTKSSHLLKTPNWSESDKGSTVYSGFGGGSGDTMPGCYQPGVTSVISAGAKTSHDSYSIRMGEAKNPVDMELARIDADLEVGVVRVDREIQQDEKVLSWKRQRSF